MTSGIIFQYLYFAIFIMFAFIGVQQLMFKRKLQLNYFLTVLFWAGGYNMFYYWLYNIDFLSRVPFLLNTEICAAFLIGPFLFLYFSALMGEERISVKKILCHGIPFLVALVIVIVKNLTDETILFQHKAQVSSIPDYSSDKIIFVINTICDLSIAGYFLAAAIKTIFILKERKITKKTRNIIFFLISFSLSAVLLILSTFISNPALLQISMTFLSIFPLAFIFFSFRFPGYAIKVIQETKEIRKSKALKLPYDIKKIDSNLNKLIYDKNVYKDPNLSLNSLCKQLSLTPHELSYYLNNEKNMNFNSYINSFRIEEAKSLILKHNDRKIIDIAFDVGFNSSSSFYRYFINETGVSPKKYKESITGKKIF